MDDESDGEKGDFLVLGASGSNDIIRGNLSVDYNQDLYALGGTNSVASLIIPDREAALDPSVAQIISRADGIFIKGGAQNKYLDWWKGTPVSQAINNAIARGVPVAGTSARTEVLGQFIYSSDYDSTRSTQAMADPFDANLTLDQNFIAPNLYPFLNNTYVDTHFENRNRMGRMVAVLARIDANGWSRKHQPMGIGINQESALLIEPNGQTNLFMLQRHRQTPFPHPQFAPGQTGISYDPFQQKAIKKIRSRKIHSLDAHNTSPIEQPYF